MNSLAATQIEGLVNPCEDSLVRQPKHKRRLQRLSKELQEGVSLKEKRSLEKALESDVRHSTAQHCKTGFGTYPFSPSSSLPSRRYRCYGYR